MHDNVGKALELIDVKDVHDAEEACTVLSAVIKMSYTDPSQRASFAPLDIGDLALDACEYACVLKELASQGWCSRDDSTKCRWLLARLPCSMCLRRLLPWKPIADGPLSLEYDNNANLLRTTESMQELYEKSLP